MATIEKALDYLIQKSFRKMGYIKHPSDDPKKEIQAILRSNDIGQQTLALQTEESNPDAIKEIRGYIDLSTRASRPIVLHDMIEKKFSNRPYGWPASEVVILIARLVVVNEITLVMKGATLPVEKMYDPLTSPGKWREMTVVKRQTVDPSVLQAGE